MSTSTDKSTWRPSTSIETLLVRAEMLRQIRCFFLDRDILEVETPLLSKGTVTDVYLEAFSTSYQDNALGEIPLYLQTSPEFAMKRLLSAGTGSIYQICKAFRCDEAGRYHNPEFTMLEWYRIDFNHQDLMSEMNELLTLILETETADIISYQQLFIEHLDVDPLTASELELQKIASQKAQASILDDRDQLLQCLFSILIEPNIAQERPLMVCDYPASQSALAQISSTDPRVAERFEVYYQGIELANGFHELKDPIEQKQRFIEDNSQRMKLNKDQKPLDTQLLDALSSGLPNCAGVAMGLDRLLMLKLQKSHISEVLPFTIERA
jgi:lysyl-tRNA synthetase class 2